MSLREHPWPCLVLAGLLEAMWATGLRGTAGFTRPGPSLAVAALIAASMFLLATAARTLPVGTAYAVWVGIGSAGAVALGIGLYGESASPARLLCLALLLGAVLGLKLTA